MVPRLLRPVATALARAALVRRAGGFERAAVVVGAPAIGFDLNDVVAPGHGFGFLTVRGRGGDEAEADDLGFGRAADDAEVVVADGGDVSSAAGAVVVIGAR